MSTQTRPSREPHRTPAHSRNPAPARPATAWGAFARHYLEMVMTMAVGMIVLHPLWAVGLHALGLPRALDHATVMALVMATDMSLGMGAWMRFRGHSWRSIAEMSAAMYLPFAVFLPPVWAGAMSGGAMITALLNTSLGVSGRIRFTVGNCQPASRSASCAFQIAPCT